MTSRYDSVGNHPCKILWGFTMTIGLVVGLSYSRAPCTLRWSIETYLWAVFSLVIRS